MIVENFSQSLINSGLFRLYIATGFFSTVIFFIFNADLFTPFEMILGTIGVTVCLKGIANIMLSMMIAFFSLNERKEEIDFEMNAANVETNVAEHNLNEKIKISEDLAKDLK